MAKEGSVAPKERVNVTFTPDGNDASEEVELVQDRLEGTAGVG